MTMSHRKINNNINRSSATMLLLELMKRLLWSK